MRPDEKIEGSGRLPAAAPDLYEALEALVFAARIDCPRTVAWTELLATCQGALRKARGK